MDGFVRDIWYFLGLGTDVKAGHMTRRIIAGEPINFGRSEDGEVFALRDICPHRAAPLSAGCVKSGTVECPYHGWRFDLRSGACVDIPALASDQEVQTERIKVKTYPAREIGALVWVYLSSDKNFTDPPPIDPPTFNFAKGRAAISDDLTLNCHVDHAVIGLMDPAHGPYVHRQWWWRSERSVHEKAKAFEPRERGFAMAAHRPSSNSFAYKLLRGAPITEITFQLPGIRTEQITIGKKTVLSFTAVTPIDESHAHIRQVFFSDHLAFKLLRPFIRAGAKKFLRQDAKMVDLQQEGLRFGPALMLIDDADTQAKWYHALKRNWAKANQDGTPFVNPVKAKTLRWRS